MAVPDMIGFVVADMATTLRFYRMIGLDIPPDADGEGHVETITPNGYRLAWDTEALVRSFNPGWQPPTGSRLTVAFKCASPADVDALFARLTDAGAESVLAPCDAAWGQRYAIVKDPDGNSIDLFARLG
ncbi:MAG: VOC family protein [Thermoflexales bacterium]|nr:VOC family protein [Thermoflexales bacterium]